MSRLFQFRQTLARDPAIEAWFAAHPGPLGGIARHWFTVLRDLGPDMREILHDGHPTACVGTAALAYVNAFSAHVNLGFFLGAELEDQAGLLLGSGKFMRHVKLRPGQSIDEEALTRLLEAAYQDLRRRLA